jgi:hypothetical protein
VRTRTYIDQLKGVLVVVLAVIVTALTIVGIVFLPSSGGFPSVVNNMTLSVEETGFPAVNEVIDRVGNGSTLTIQGADTNPTDQHNQPYSVFIYNIGSAYLCTPDSVVVNGGGNSFPVPHQHLQGSLPSTGGNGEVTSISEVTGHGYLFVRMCWKSRGPVALSGSYLSAQFPGFGGYGSTSSYAVTHQLNPVAGNTSNYLLQSIEQPTSVIPTGWQWSGYPRVLPIAVSAVNTSATQHDSYLAFLGGIAFGVAGGAAITLIQELLAPFSGRRRQPVTSSAAVIDPPPPET